MRITSLENMLVDELRDIYGAEIQMNKALPKMSRAVVSDDLRTTLENHLKQTQTHTQRLEEICNDLKIKLKSKKCAGMEGISKRVRK